MLKKNKGYIFLGLLILLSGCCKRDLDRESLYIPTEWYSPLTKEMCRENPVCFNWWEALNDPVLTDLIEQASMRNIDVLLAEEVSTEKCLETVNIISAEVAKTYMELRALQERLIVLNGSIESQNITFSLNEGLSTTGFINTSNQNETKKVVDSLKGQKLQIEFSIDKTIFHLSTLLSYPPGYLYETLITFRSIPTIPGCLPVGSPQELIERHPSILQARKQYQKAGNLQSYYNYQKSILTVLEEVESALAALYYDQNKTNIYNNIAKLKADIYNMSLELHKKGLKDDRDIQNTLQEFLLVEDEFIQTHLQLLLDYLNLYRALSGGWEVCSK